MSRYGWLFLSLVLTNSVHLTAQTCQRSVIVNVQDAHGSPIPDLTAADFQARQNGQPLTISSASLRTDPGARTVVLFNDEVQGKIGNASALEFIATAPPQARISMFTFFTSVEQTFNSSGGRQPMIDWLKSSLTSPQPAHKGFSDLAQTLLTIVKGMPPSHPGDSIYVITGNIDTLFFEPKSKQVSTVAPQLAQDLQSSGIRLFVFFMELLPRRAWDVIQPDNNMLTVPQVPLTGKAALADLVKDSGGLYLDWYPGSRSTSFGPSWEFNGATQEAIRGSARGFQTAIDNYYVLTVTSAQRSTALDDWNLEVIDSRGKKLKGVTLAYPSKIPGCTP